MDKKQAHPWTAIPPLTEKSVPPWDPLAPVPEANERREGVEDLQE